jgi:hypothetical protein
MRWIEREIVDHAADHAEVDAQAERVYAAQRHALAALPQGHGLMSDAEMGSRWQQAWNDGAEPATARGRQAGVEAGS